LESRVKRLEQEAQPSGGVVVIFKSINETEEDAKRRWLVAHHGQSLNDAGLTVYILRWTEEAAQYR